MSAGSSEVFVEVRRGQQVGGPGWVGLVGGPLGVVDLPPRLVGDPTIVPAVAQRLYDMLPTGRQWAALCAKLAEAAATQEAARRAGEDTTATDAALLALCALAVVWPDSPFADQPADALAGVLVDTVADLR